MKKEIYGMVGKILNFISKILAKEKPDPNLESN